MNWRDKWQRSYTVSSDAGNHPTGPPGPPGPEGAFHAPPPAAPTAPRADPAEPAPDWDDLVGSSRPRTRAVFPSDCHGCGGRIWEGDEIFRADDGDWVCSEECAE